MSAAPMREARESPERYVALDGLRGIAAAVVAVAHGFQTFYPNLNSVNPSLGWLAREAVVVFFVISGFAICASIRAIDPARRGFAYEYALRRASRIVPPLVFAIGVSCAVAAAMSALFATQWTVDFEQFVRGITLTYRSGDLIAQVNGPLWSLRLEVLLYVLAGALALSIARKGLERWGMMVLVLLLATVMVAKLWFALPAILLFAFGALASLATTFVFSRRWATMAAAVCLTITVVGCFLEITTTFEGLDSVGGVALELLTGACVAVIFASVRTGKQLSVLWRGAAGLGAFSYTLYIVHYPALLLLGTFTKSATPDPTSSPSIVVFVCSLAGVFLFAAATARIFEQPQWYRRHMRRLPVLWKWRRA